MCDYSLHSVSSRPARIADKLVTTKFRHTTTRGFSAVDEPGVAVCLRPGTELAFEAEVQAQTGLLRTFVAALLRNKDGVVICHRVGRFRQIKLNDPNIHHDAIEFPDGRMVLLTHLQPGQHATVLQLPSEGHQPAETEIQNGTASSPEPRSRAAAEA